MHDLLTQAHIYIAKFARNSKVSFVQEARKKKESDLHPCSIVLCPSKNHILYVQFHLVRDTQLALSDSFYVKIRKLRISWILAVANWVILK